MLKDIARIKLKSGSGGHGIISFDNQGKAYGGNGGKGGDVVIVGDTNIYDLSHFDHEKLYKAEDGANGQVHRKSGGDGENLLVKVPLVTKVYDSEGNEVVKITEHGQEYVLVEGGTGGTGNFELRGEGWDGKLSRTRREEGVEVYVKLELNLKADAILLGYPNAGKSSIINALTRSRSKVASYEFTTLEPQLGVMDGYIKLMDLPGLIEGTHKGKGVGTKFLKHTLNSNLLIHCISAENEDVKERYDSMREEFKKISPTLSSMKEIVAITKVDVLDLDSRDKLEKLCKEIFKDFVLVSTFLPETLEELGNRIKEILNES